MSENTPQVVSVDEVLAARDGSFPVTLPDSGWTVRIRKVALLELAAGGRIPDELATTALVSLSEALDEAREQKPVEAKRTMRRRLDLINAVACALLVEPSMSEEDRQGTIKPSDLPLADRIHLYGIATGSVEGPSLARFPGGSGADLDAGADGAGVGGEAVVAAGAA